MTMMPDINRILEHNNVVNPVNRRTVKLPYQDKIDMNFDFDKGDMVANGNIVRDDVGNETIHNLDIRRNRGIINIRNWIRKALNTERDVFPVYTNEYGFDLFTIFGKSVPNDIIMLMLPSFIDITLTHHPNIIRVDDVQVNIQEGDVFSTFNVILDDEQTFTEDYAWVLV